MSGKYKLKYEVPDPFLVFISLLVIVGGLGWLLHLGGLTWEQWPPLKWICIVPIIIGGSMLLPTVIKRVRKWTEIH